MPAKTVAERAAQDPRLKAMLMELGSARLDQLPMEDGEGGKRDRDTYTSSHPSTLSSGGVPGGVPNVPIKSAWAKAMQQGDFDDDDAAQVSGMDSMADGQLARARRHQVTANTGCTFPNDNYEKNMRRDRNGYVPPRATAGNHSKRILPGPIHAGDGPIDIDGTLSGGAAQKPRFAPSRSMAMFGRGAFAGGPPSRPSAGAPPRSEKRLPVNVQGQRDSPTIPTQPAAVKPQGQISQGAQPAAEAQTRIVLPHGAAVVLQLPASLGAAVYPKNNQKFSGMVYLISGSIPSEDLMILTVQDDNIPEIRHPISEYDTYMSVNNTGLMLKFTNSTRGFNFYGVDFEDATDMNAFIQALQKLVERPKQLPQCTLATSTIEDMSAGNDCVSPTVKVMPIQPTLMDPVDGMKPAATKISEVTSICEQKTDASTQKQEKTPAAVATMTAPEQTLPQPVQTASASMQQAQGPSGVSREVIEDIINWAWDTVRYMLDSDLEEFGFDDMRIVIRATSFGVIGRASPSFRQLSPVDQQHIIEEYVRPQVERGFWRKLARDEKFAAKFESTEVRQTMMPQQVPETQDNAEAQAAARSKLSGPFYKVEELIKMRPTAAVMEPDMLPKIPGLPLKFAIRQSIPELPQDSVGEQVEQDVVAKSDSLYVTSSLYRDVGVAN